MFTQYCFLLLLAAAQPTGSVSTDQRVSKGSNPVRKVITMLQAMQKKVVAEGEREKEHHEKFVHYCHTYSDAKLRKQIAVDNSQVEDLISGIEAGKGKAAQLVEDLQKHKKEEKVAKAAVAEATALREKEAAEFAAQDADDKKNTAAIKKAIAAIKRGMSSAFLQTNEAQDVQRLFANAQDVDDGDRRDILSFFSQSEGAPGSASIVGILQGMLDTMSKAMEDAKAAESVSVAQYEQLMVAKQTELKALASAIEKKTARDGELSVQLADMENDLADTKDNVKENTKLLSQLDKECDSAEAQYAKNKEMRAEELQALSETIKALNDDDALELFKKALPPGGSFIQIQVNSNMMRQRALEAIGEAVARSQRPKLDLITLALRGKKIGFESIIRMIDELIATLKKEGQSDEDKKQYCTVEFDSAEEEKKSSERSLSDVNAALDDAKTSILSLQDDISALKDGITDLDKSVAEATEQRKIASQEFTELMTSDTAAKELLQFAKNRLNKFYNPKLYVPPPKKELSPQEAIASGMTGAASSFLQASILVSEDAPPPSPQAVSAYKEKSKESTGVIEMINLLISDLNKQMAQREAVEKQGQADYEVAMQDSSEKRKADVASMQDKTSEKADLEGQLQRHKDDHKATKKELATTLQYINSLHSECDFIQKYSAIRQEARNDEVNALDKAKAILNGADFSLTQTHSKRMLRQPM